MLSRLKSVIFPNNSASSGDGGGGGLINLVKNTSRNAVFGSMVVVSLSTYISIYYFSGLLEATPGFDLWKRKAFVELEHHIDYLLRRIKEVEEEARKKNKKEKNQEGEEDDETAAVAEARRRIILELAEEIWSAQMNNWGDMLTKNAPKDSKYASVLPFHIPYIYKCRTEISVTLENLCNETSKTVIGELDRRFDARIAAETDPVRQHALRLQRVHEEKMIGHMVYNLPRSWFMWWRGKVIDYSLELAGVKRAFTMTWRLLTSTTATEAVLGKEFAEELDVAKKKKEEALASKSSPEVVKLVAKFKTQQLNERDGGAGLLTNLVSWYNTSPLLRVERYPIGLRLAMLFGIQFAQAAFERWQRIHFGRAVKDTGSSESLSTRTVHAVLPAFVTLASAVVSNFAWSKLSSSITLDMSRALSKRLAYSFAMSDAQFLEKGKLEECELFAEEEDDGTDAKDRKYPVKRPLSKRHSSWYGSEKGYEAHLKKVEEAGNKAIYAPVTFVKNICDVTFGLFDLFSLIRVFVQSNNNNNNNNSDNNKISSSTSTSTSEKEMAAKQAREKLMSGLTLAWWLFNTRFLAPLLQTIKYAPYEHMYRAFHHLLSGAPSAETQAERRELFKLPLGQCDTRHGADLLLTVAVEREQKKKNSKQQNSNNNNNNTKQEEADRERRRLALYTCLTFQNGGCTRFAEKSRLHVWEKMKSDSEFKSLIDGVNEVTSQTVHNFYFAPYEKKTNWIQESFALKTLIGHYEQSGSDGDVLRLDKEERDILVLTPLRRQWKVGTIDMQDAVGNTRYLGFRIGGSEVVSAIKGLKEKLHRGAEDKLREMAEKIMEGDVLLTTAITLLRRRIFLNIIAWYLHRKATFSSSPSSSSSSSSSLSLLSSIGIGNKNNDSQSLILDFADGFTEAIEKQGNNNNNNNNSTVVSKGLHHIQTFRGAVNQLVSDASNALAKESAETRDAWLSEVDLRTSNLSRLENSFSWECLDVYESFETYFGYLSKFRGSIDTGMHSSDASFTEHPAFRHKKPLEIEFRNVWFDYNLTGAQLDQIPEQRRKKRMEKFHLKDVSFTIKPGETIGISGASGGGKSSIFKLLMRQYDPTRGQILINGVDLKTFTDVRAWRRNAVTIIDQVLAQETEAVIPKQLSVRENVEFGREAITREDIDNALIAADCNSFVSRLPLGADTQIGTKLSTGERQRICIARGFAKLAPLMLFDEMTSALDAASEKKVMDGYFDLKCQSASSASSKTNAAAITTIMIAHRMATLKRADKLLIISDGRVVGFDSHDELYKSCKIYQELYDRQSLLRKDEEKKQEQAKVEQDISLLEAALTAYKKTIEEKQSRREKGASKKTAEQIAADKKRGEEENLLTCEIETFLSSCASS